MSDKIILSAKNLSKAYDGRVILSDISFEICYGEFISIVGASGSGKSTLLKLLGAIERTDSGELVIDGHIISSDLTANRDINSKKLDPKFKNNAKTLRHLRREVLSFCFQEFNLIDNLNVYDNIVLPTLLGERNTQYLEELIDLLGIRHILKSDIGKISGGEAQRVALARAMIKKPKIIFLDEPIGSLDSKNGLSIMENLSYLNQYYGVTIVQVTHNLDSLKYGSRVITIADGRITDDKIIRESGGGNI